jgi:predicted Zn finger-like uncharacterized protein
MILTCPACDTKYVVKDDAIPPGGRQVRCASCKHSWHQDPETLVLQAEAAPEAGLGVAPPPPAPEAVEQPLAEVPPEAEAEGEFAGEPQPEVEDAAESAWGAVREEPAPAAGEPWPPASAESAPIEPADTAAASGWREVAPAGEEFLGYAPIAEEERRRRRWPMLIVLLLLIAAAAAAFWFYAPPEWKARAGIAEAGATPLQLMITNRDRQLLESGNELVAISGRIINPTDVEQKVPPIHAELRDARTKVVVHRWTIAPPAQVLAPRSSASFNSAEVDVPKGGDELTITLGG